MGFLDNTGLSDVLTRIKNAFVAKADTQTVTGVDMVEASAVSVDSTPTENSTNLVTSGGVYAAIPSVTGKADKVSSPTSGNFAGLDANGNLTDSGSKASDFLTSHQDISGKEDTSNKVTSLSSNSTDTQYPSAKCVYDLVGDIETLLSAI